MTDSVQTMTDDSTIDLSNFSHKSYAKATTTYCLVFTVYSVLKANLTLPLTLYTTGIKHIPMTLHYKYKSIYTKLRKIVKTFYKLLNQLKTQYHLHRHHIQTLHETMMFC